MTENEQDRTEALPFDLYLRHRHFLNETMHDQAKAFDKGILSLSSGALGLSILFMERLAPKPVLCKLILAVSWFLFAFAILATLYSFLVSQRVHRELIAEWDAMQSTHMVPRTGVKDRLDMCVKWLNRLAALLFFFGVFTMVIFATVNLMKE